jgi:hypothetical protein
LELSHGRRKRVFFSGNSNDTSGVIIKFVRAERKNVLTVSNAAFRYTPDAKFVAPEFRKELEKTDAGRRLWVPAANGLLKPVYVKTGLNTGVSSQIVSGDIKEVAMVVNGQVEVTLAAGDKVQRSPFLPQAPRRRNRNQNRANAGQPRR